MADVPRNEAYFTSHVDSSEIDRLIVHARLRDPHVRDGLHRIGIGAGHKAIDVGCGPLGALLVLADVIGPTGTVVGLDMDATSLQRAAVILRQRGHEDVRLVHANIDAMPVASVCPPGPFDVAVCSQFINNQPDPADTLRRVAAFVRSGGHVLVQSPVFFEKHPRSEPEVPALDKVMGWFGELMRRRGASPHCQKLPRPVSRSGADRSKPTRLLSSGSHRGWDSSAGHARCGCWNWCADRPAQHRVA